MRPGELMARLVGASAGVIAVAALATAVYTAWITREQQKLSVWPYVMIVNSDSGGQYNLLVRNAGLGPALVRTFQLKVDGRPARSWPEIVRRRGWKGLPAGSMHSDLGPGWVVLPGQTMSIFMLPDTVSGRRFRTEVLPHLDVDACYCSLYGDCWRFTGSDQPHPAPCPQPKAEHR